MTVLYAAHGKVGGHLRALLGHPGANTVITALVTRGEVEKERLAEAEARGAGTAEEAAAVEAWRTATEALGAAYLEGAE